MRSSRRWAAAAAALVATAAGAVALTGGSASAEDVVARATLSDTAGNEVGEVVFKGKGKFATRVEVTVEASGVPNPGTYHGLHVHTKGECNPAPSGTANVPFGSAEGHWNPTAVNHGLHLGDLPSVLVTAAGTSFAEAETDRFDVSGLFDADGSAVILHAGADNFANIPVSPYGGPVGATLTTGDAGSRYACGVVE
jgi:Cu-Zn family superoxide dismutase